MEGSLFKPVSCETSPLLPRVSNPGVDGVFLQNSHVYPEYVIMAKVQVVALTSCRVRLRSLIRKVSIFGSIGDGFNLIGSV